MHIIIIKTVNSFMILLCAANKLKTTFYSHYSVYNTSCFYAIESFIFYCLNYSFYMKGIWCTNVQCYIDLILMEGRLCSYTMDS